MKLGTLLLRDSVISLSQLEAALRAQVLYGGRLGTNLVELDFVDVDTLGAYLSQVVDVPLATKEMFEAADPKVIEWFGEELADLYTAFPLGFDADDPNMLAVALSDPRDDLSVEQLATQCDRPIVPYIAPELRVYYYLEKHYGMSRKARYVRTGTRRTVPGHADERRRAQAPRGIEIPPMVRFEPNKRATTDVGQVEGNSDDAAKAKPHVSFANACTTIDKADHRDQIGRAFIDYAIGRLEVAIVFLMRDANALGWRHHSATEHSSKNVEQLALPLGGTSVLQAAYDSGQPYRGKSPSAGRPIEKQLWEATGVKKDPADMLVVPIRVRARVVNLVYVHAFGGGEIDGRCADELIELATKASDAYVRLIQAAKNAAHAQPAQ